VLFILYGPKLYWIKFSSLIPRMPTVADKANPSPAQIQQQKAAKDQTPPEKVDKNDVQIQMGNFVQPDRSSAVVISSGVSHLTSADQHVVNYSTAQLRPALPDSVAALSPHILSGQSEANSDHPDFADHLSSPALPIQHPSLLKAKELQAAAPVSSSMGGQRNDATHNLQQEQTPKAPLPPLTTSPPDTSIGLMLARQHQESARVGAGLANAPAHLNPSSTHSQSRMPESPPLVASPVSVSSAATPLTAPSISFAPHVAVSGAVILPGSASTDSAPPS